MTETAPEPPEVATATVITPRKNSQLDQLHALYLDLHAQKDEIESKFKAVADAIKVELNNSDPEQRRFDLVSKDGRRPLRLTYAESRRFDSTRLKREQPALYVSYLKEPSGSWTLKPAAPAGDS